LKVAKYIKLEISDPNSSRQTIKHTPEGVRYLEVVDKCSSRRAFQDREFGKNIIRLGSSGEIDTLLVNSITYLGKNGLDILKTIKILTALVNMMASIYQHEEKIKLEKQKQGIHSAKSKGVYKKNGGNKPKLNYGDFINKEKNKNCLLELKKGESIRKSAELSGVSLGTAVKVKKLAETNGDLF
jgi:DNA invertase Pin-like site-specific DNA recombinase